MRIVLCEDNQGYRWATIVQTDCGESGIIVGPPAGLEKDLHNLLVENGFYSVQELKGQRKKLLQLVNRNKATLHMIYHVYQMDYWRK